MIQIHNRLYDQMNGTGGLAALLKWDETVLDNFTVPDTIDRELAINVILMRDGARPLTHPNPDWMKYHLGVWSKMMSPIWAKLQASTEFDYNPIYNYDRTEEHEDIRKITRDRKIDAQTEGTTDTNGTVTNNNMDTGEVSAENADDYQPESRTTTEGDSTNDQITNTDSRTKTDDNEEENEVYSHKVRSQGNIGVTTTQQMIESEREVVRYSVYDEIEQNFVDEFCLKIW